MKQSGSGSNGSFIHATHRNDCLKNYHGVFLFECIIAVLPLMEIKLVDRLLFDIQTKFIHLEIGRSPDTDMHALTQHTFLIVSDPKTDIVPVNPECTVNFKGSSIENTKNQHFSQIAIIGGLSKVFVEVPISKKRLKSDIHVRRRVELKENTGVNLTI